MGETTNTRGCNHNLVISWRDLHAQYEYLLKYENYDGPGPIGW